MNESKEDKNGNKDSNDTKLPLIYSAMRGESSLSKGIGGNFSSMAGDDDFGAG